MHTLPQRHVLAIMLAALLAVTWTGTAAEPAPAAASPSARLLAKVTNFRQQALSQPDAAFVRFVGNQAKARQLFGPLGRTLCPTSDPAQGWCRFFESSVWDLKFINFTTAAAVFYHPYSDVALVTIWTRNDAGTTLSDAELLMGDALRNQGKPPYQVEPYWLRSPQPAYLAAGIASARTLRAAGQILTSANKAAKGGWRSAYPSLANARVMEANRLGVGAMFERNLAALARYLTDTCLDTINQLTATARSN